MPTSPSAASHAATSADIKFDPLTAAMVSVGAAAGACARLWLSTEWPGMWTIVAVNVAGCFLLGLLTTWVGRWKPLLGAGFCGGFTTFSTFALPLATAAGWQGEGWLAAAVTVAMCPLAYFLANKLADSTIDSAVKKASD